MRAPQGVLGQKALGLELSPLLPEGSRETVVTPPAETPQLLTLHLGKTPRKTQQSWSCSLGTAEVGTDPEVAVAARLPPHCSPGRAESCFPAQPCLGS